MAYRFDREAIKGRLLVVAPTSRRLFALVCAERLLPLYRLFSERTKRGDYQVLRGVLDRLWEGLPKGPPWEHIRFLEEHEDLIPGEHHEQRGWTHFDALAENAATALAYACECNVSGSIDPAAWAAESACEAVDYLAGTDEKPGLYTKQIEISRLENVYVQQELERQDRDLSEIQELRLDDGVLTGAIKSFRDRAASEGASLAVAVSHQLEKDRDKKKAKGTRKKRHD